MCREMKDSGVQWIGDIPTAWSICKLKNIATITTGNTPPKNEDNYYSENGLPWIKPDNLIGFNGVSESKEHLSNKGRDVAKVVPENTLLICCIGSIGKFGYTNSPAAFNQQINAIEFNNKDILWKYGMYYMSTQEEQQKYYMNGNVVFILNLENQKKVYLPKPSLEEQHEIVNYLDKKVSQVDDIISKQKILIEKYKSYKQSLITETVTKGLNKNVPMKDSGIEWIGEIPSHWKVIKVKNTCYLKGRIGWQGLKTNEFIDDGPYLITGTDFRNGGIDWNTCVHITEDRYDEAIQIQIKEGDLLITKDGTIGKLAIVKNMPYKTSLNSGVLLIRCIKDLYINKFLYYVLSSGVFWKWYKINQTGNSTILHLYQEKFKEFQYALPDLEEQQQIIYFLDKKCSVIDFAIAKKEQLIEKLEAYKKSLIYECVTGKREVN